MLNVALLSSGGSSGGLRRVGIELSLKRIKEVIQDIFSRARATCDEFGRTTRLGREEGKTV